MLRTVVYAYAAVSLGLIAVSIATGRRATILTGHSHYLLTRTHVFVERPVAATSPTDEAFDALFAEAGESTAMTVEEPLFVLGLLDATGPAVLAGGLFTLAVWRASRRRLRATVNQERHGVS